MTFLIWFLPEWGDVSWFNSLCHDPTRLVVLGNFNRTWLETEQISGENNKGYRKFTLLGLSLVLIQIFSKYVGFFKVCY